MALKDIWNTLSAKNFEQKNFQTKKMSENISVQNFLNSENYNVRNSFKWKKSFLFFFNDYDKYSPMCRGRCYSHCHRQ